MHPPGNRIPTIGEERFPLHLQFLGSVDPIEGLRLSKALPPTPLVCNTASVDQAHRNRIKSLSQSFQDGPFSSNLRTAGLIDRLGFLFLHFLAGALEDLATQSFQAVLGKAHDRRRLILRACINRRLPGRLVNHFPENVAPKQNEGRHQRR